MTTQEPDLGALVEHLFVDEPDHPPVAGRITAGRRALRRRRLAVGAGALALVVVAGGGYAVLTDGPRPSAGPVTDPTTSAPTSPSSPASPASTAPDDGFTADEQQAGYRIEADGHVTVSPEADLLARVDVPVKPGVTQVLTGLDLVRDGAEQWVLVDWRDIGHGSGASHSDRQPDPRTTFRAWVEQEATGEHAVDAPPVVPDSELGYDPIEYTHDILSIDIQGHVTFHDGVQVLEEYDNPLGLEPPYTSGDYRVRYQGHESWWEVTPKTDIGEPGYQSGESLGLRPYGHSFADAVADDVSAGPEFTVPEANMGTGPKFTLTESHPAMPRFLPGSTVLTTVDNPLGVAAPARSVGYEVRVDRDDSTYWLLWEIGPSGYRGAMSIHPAGDGYADLASWLAVHHSRLRW